MSVVIYRMKNRICVTRRKLKTSMSHISQRRATSGQERGTVLHLFVSCAKLIITFIHRPVNPCQQQNKLLFSPLSSTVFLQAEVVVNYHVGETVLSLQKTTLIPGGSESLVYTTLSGGIGILVPFTSHEV